MSEEKTKASLIEKLRHNDFYEATDIPALTLVNQSQSWITAIFWYIIFIAFGTICVISLVHQYKEFKESPTQTEVANIHSNDIQLPNMSVCFYGWPTLDMEKKWMPNRQKAIDAPTWVHILAPHV